MKSLNVVGMILLAALASLWPWSTQAAPRPWNAQVVEVIDGDTLVVLDARQRKHHIRMQGIDAPETAHTLHGRDGKRCDQAAQPGGEQARQALLRKVMGQAVRIEPDGSKSHDREVAYVLLGSRDINLEMVTEGWAWNLAKFHRAPSVRDTYARAQSEAQAMLRGLWGKALPQRPGQWRADHKCRF
jgi:endonuclease YncB( thermonuclease family)